VILRAAIASIFTLRQPLANNKMPVLRFGYNRLYTSIVLGKALGSEEQRLRIQKSIDDRSDLRSKSGGSYDEQDELKSAELKRLTNSLTKELMDSDESISLAITQTRQEAFRVVKSACLSLGATKVEENGVDSILVSVEGDVAYAKFESLFNIDLPNSNLGYLRLLFDRIVSE